MENIYNIIKQHGKFYSLLNNRYTVEKESFDIQEHNQIMTIKSQLVLDSSKLNSFVKLLVKVLSFSTIKLDITVIIYKNLNKITYVLQTNHYEECFETHGSILFDNDSNILLHENQLQTESNILKMKQFNKMIKNRMEEDISLIFSNLIKLK
jgi:hypothetical protein